MKIGRYDVRGDDETNANKIVSAFLKRDSKITGGFAPGGKNSLNDRHYCLNTDVLQNVGIKRKSHDICDLNVELVVRDIRERLAFTRYKIERISGFPINGDRWRKECLLISDWGKEGSRTDLRVLAKNNSGFNREKFLREFAVNSALSCFLGFWDRALRNFVWDNDEEKIISIDHERLYSEIINTELYERLSGCIKEFYGTNWYDADDNKEVFSHAFRITWECVISNIDEIGDICKRYGFSKVAELLYLRRSLGPDFFIGNIML